MRPVEWLGDFGSVVLQMKLTDDYSAGKPDAHKSPVDERYGLLASTINSSPRWRRVCNCEQWRTAARGMVAACKAIRCKPYRYTQSLEEVLMKNMVDFENR